MIFEFASRVDSRGGVDIFCCEAVLMWGKILEERRTVSVFPHSRVMKNTENRVDRQLQWNQDNAAAPDPDPQVLHVACYSQSPLNPYRKFVLTLS